MRRDPGILGRYMKASMTSWVSAFRLRCIACPDEDFTVLIHCELLPRYEFMIQYVETRIIKITVELKGIIRDSASGLKQANHLVEHL